MKKILLSSLAAAALAFGSNAQVITNTDNAANYGGAGEPGWTNGSTAGAGFAAWNLYTGGGSAGNFLGSSATAGFGDIDTGGQSFGMWGNPTGTTNYFNAERAFSSALSTGDTFSIDLAIAYRNGNKGINLYAGGFGTEVWNFNAGGDQYYAGGSTLGWAYDQASVFKLTATQTSATQVGISLIRGTDTYSTNVTVASGLSGFKAYVGSTDDGNALNNLFINNLQTTVVPEPSTYALLALSAAGVAGYAVRRRRR